MKKSNVVKFVGLALGLTLATSVSAETKIGDDATETAAQAYATWTGFVEAVVPGSNLTITGAEGGEMVPGTLLIGEDGTFTSTEVIMEAHDYTPDTELVGDIQPDAEWTYVNSQVLIGGNVTQEADVELLDSKSGDTLVENSGTPLIAGVLALSVINNTPVTDVSVEGAAQVQVLMSASFVDGM